MKQSTRLLRNRFNKKKTTQRFKNWKLIQRYLVQANLCCFCKKPLHGEVHIDHVNPISHSSSNRVNNYSNLVITCKICNKIKSDKTGIQYPEWVKRRKNKLKNVKYADKIKLSEEIKHGYKQ